MAAAVPRKVVKTYPDVNKNFVWLELECGHEFLYPQGSSNRDLFSNSEYPSHFNCGFCGERVRRLANVLKGKTVWD